VGVAVTGPFRPGQASRPGTPVIPAGWETHHRPVPEGAMTAQCVISRPGAGNGTYDPTTGKATPAPATEVYTGPARVQPQSFRPLERAIGERPRTVHRYLLVVPLDCPRVLVGDRVDITAATDPLLVGTAARVLDFPVGSLVWERDLICEVLGTEN
jgi:hypothetical protein